MIENFRPGLHPSQRHAYLAEICDRLEHGTPDVRDALVAKAHRLIAKWESSGRLRPWYKTTWLRLLSGPVSEMRAAIMADDEQGRELRHFQPFAGILTDAEIAELMRNYPKFQRIRQ